ncbi:FMN reductase [Streptomyces sp. NPDC047315]|uniref:FMN reductase n=1 Tax=Streptomyces sp. NPDC047315 TaxID=3155142 RepID=UPI0033D55930
MTLKLVAVSAGLSVPSSTRLLADRLTESVRGFLGELPGGAGATGPAGAVDGAVDASDVEVRVVELRELAVAIANHLVTGFPSADLEEAIEAVTEADGLIAVTPVFSASYSGLFKSFFDLIDPDALTGKPVLVGATGGTPRHSLVLEHALRPLFAYLRAEVVPTAVYAASEDWGGNGDPLTDTLPTRITRAGRQLARAMLDAAQSPTAAASAEPDLSALLSSVSPRSAPGTDGAPLDPLPSA